MKYLKLLSYLLLSVFLVTACKDEDPITPVGEVKLSLQANYANQLINETSLYIYQDYQLQFSKASTYLSDVTLLQGTKEVKLADILYYNFYSDSDATSSSLVLPNVFNNIPQGTYSGIRFGVGVSPSLNSKKPTDFAAANPLSAGSEYWDNWQSYIFTKIEGLAYITTPAPTQESVIYHFGSDPVYRVITINKNIDVKDTQTSLDLVFDLSKLLHINNNEWYDVKGNPRTSHIATNTTIAEKLANNYANAFFFKQ